MNTEGGFAWADLSSPRPDAARRFYTDVFGWRFQEDGGYAIGHADDDPVSGLYETPEKFQAMGMPSFWMSYIAVSDVAETVKTAKAAGGIIELAEDCYALIRDPLGAGFTVHLSPSEIEAPLSDAPGRRAGHSLLCSDLSAIQPFYETLFGWRFAEAEGGAKTVFRGPRRIATAMESSDDIRGKAQYWAVLFASDNLAETEARALAAGGSSDAAIHLPEGHAVALRDPNGAAFFVVERLWRRGG